MQLAFHSEFLSQPELQDLPAAEPAINLLAWKVAVIIVILKMATCMFLSMKINRRPV